VPGAGARSFQRVAIVAYVQFEQAMHNLKEAVEGFFEVASPAEIETRL